MQKLSPKPAYDANAFAFPLLSPEQLWQPAMHAIGAWNETFGPAVAKCQGEYLDFLQRRIKADCVFAQELSRCKSPNEVFDTYSGFWAKVADDYQKQIQKSAELASSLAEAGMPTLPGRARE
jgi:hypothetical protein